jgi:hypothetical protein
MVRLARTVYLRWPALCSSRGPSSSPRAESGKYDIDASDPASLLADEISSSDYINA